MPRLRKLTSQTKAALFAKTLDGAPTPWISAQWINSEGADVQIKYRLWVRRRGRTLHVETHPTSMLLPGHTKPVRMSRGGMYDVLRSGLALVSMARWDPDRPPSMPRALWNENARDYALRMEHAYTVSQRLPQFLEPKRGRPRIAAPTSPTNPHAPISLRGAGRAAARRKQRNDLLVLTQRMVNLMMPMMERAVDARRMSGYVKAEQAVLWRVLHEIMGLTRQLHDLVFYDKLYVDPTPTQVAPLPHATTTDGVTDWDLALDPMPAPPPPLTHPAAGDAADWDLALDNLPMPEVQ